MRALEALVDCDEEAGDQIRSGRFNGRALARAAPAACAGRGADCAVTKAGVATTGAAAASNVRASSVDDDVARSVADGV